MFPTILKSVENKECFIENNIVNERKIFRTNKNRIDIDITYLCNLKCKGCIRSCGEAPSFECMTVQDIDDFIAESIRQEKKWERINILGGEPTLHPDFLKIIEHLQYGYSDVFNKDVVIQIVSNGKTDESRKLCKIVAEKFSNVKINDNSYKEENKIDFFTPFCDAPIDDEKFKNADFSKACWVASDSGFGLNKNGYFACPNCAGIDRVMKSNLGLKSFKDLTDENQKKQFNAFCKYCGFFKYYDSNLGNFIPREERPPFKDIISKSWKEIYEKYNKQK